MNNIIKKIKTKLRIGSWIQSSSTDVVEIIGNSNFDWICLDLEHGNISNEKLKDMVRVIELTKKFSFARLKSKNPDDVANILDTGVNGIIIPQVENAEDVKKVIKNTFYLPKKNRGVGFSRANKYGKDLKKYQIKQKKTVVIAIIENKKAYQNLDKILSVKELSGIFIGPYDLSASIGYFEKFESLKFKRIIEVIKNKTLKKKKICGIHVVDFNKEKLKEKINDGFNFIAYSMDTVVLRNYKK